MGINYRGMSDLFLEIARFRIETSLMKFSQCMSAACNALTMPTIFIFATMTHVTGSVGENGYVFVRV